MLQNEEEGSEAEMSFFFGREQMLQVEEGAVDLFEGGD